MLQILQPHITTCNDQRLAYKRVELPNFDGQIFQGASYPVDAESIVHIHRNGKGSLCIGFNGIEDRRR